MKRPPRGRGEPLFGAAEVALAIVQGGVLLAAVLGLYAWLNQEGAGEAHARTVAFVALVSGQLALAASMLMGRGHSLFGKHRRLFWLIAGAAVLATAMVLTMRSLVEIMRFAQPGPGEIAAGIAVGLAAGGWYSLRLAATSAVDAMLRDYAYRLRGSAA